MNCESEYGKSSTFIFNVNQKIIDLTPISILNEHSKQNIGTPYIPKFATEARDLVVDVDVMNFTVIKNLLSWARVFITTTI